MDEKYTFSNLWSARYQTNSIEDIPELKFQNKTCNKMPVMPRRYFTALLLENILYKK